MWFSVFCVFHIPVLLARIPSCRAQSVIGPLQPLLAAVGDDIILPCYLAPTVDASDMTVVWSRPDLDSKLVHVRPERPELQNPSYRGRTSLFISEMENGNISLKISKVKLSDEGTYRCFIPDLQRDSAFRLVVGAASSPVISLVGIDKVIGGVVLQCESAGWYPEPELLWLDGEGNLLPAGPSETLRGPDDLYTVSSRVTVEKRHGNITCRVQQMNIKQSRETHIHVPDDFFMVISPSSPPSDPTIDPNTVPGLAIGAVVVLVLILAVFCVVWKRRRVRSKRRKMNEEEGPEQIMETKTINIKSDNTEFQVVVERGESEPLITGREEENDADIRETEDQLLSEIRHITEAKRPEEEMMSVSVIAETESEFTAEEEERTGREVETESEGEKTTEAVKADSDPHTSEFTGEHREQPVLETNSFHYSLPTKQDQHREKDTQRGKDTQQERPTETDGDTKQVNAKKKKTKKMNQPEKRKKKSQRNQQENQREEHEAERQREENQRKLHSGRRAGGDETEVTTQENKHKQHGLENNKMETTEAESEHEKGKERNLRNDGKAEPQRSDQEDMIPADKIETENQRKLQPERRAGGDEDETENQEKQPEGESKKSREEIREQPEKLRGAESKEGAPGEETDVSTDETHRKEKETPQLRQRQQQMEKQEKKKIIREQPEEADQTPDGDRQNIKRSKNKADRELHQAQKPSVRKQKHQRESRARIQRTGSKMLKEGLKKQSSDQMLVDDPEAIARLVQIIKHDKDQQKLPVEEETQGSDDCEMDDLETGEGDQED